MYDRYFVDSNYKFNKMVSLDDNYAVLWLKNEAKNKKKSKPLQRVDDYIEKIADIEDLLKDFPSELVFYQNLTPGYKKNWARFVYSAKTQKTIDKRLKQMIDILSEGYKSIDLYMADKND